MKRCNGTHMAKGTGKVGRKGRHLTPPSYFGGGGETKFIYQISVPTTEIISEKLFLYPKLSRSIGKNDLKWIKHKQVPLLPHENI
jgi:hypothetical protein